jgi:ribonucleoside-triphosphate reductase
MDTTEGVHKPLGKYIFNNVQFSKHDPVVEKLREAGYRVFNHPTDDSGVLVTFPVMWDGVPFDKVDGKEVNKDSAISQLEVYKMLMDNYCQQNVSCTISYSVDETDQIVDWLYQNWDSYVAVSFLFRNDPSKTAKDLGYPYLPQEVVTKEDYEEYVRRLLPVDIDGPVQNSTKPTSTKPTQIVQEVEQLPDPQGQEPESFYEIKDQDCATGACPVR